MIFGIYPFFLMGMMLTEIIIDPIGNPQASRFFIVNAAIKNTCFIDPERNNCPQTLEQIEYIEPSQYRSMRVGTQVQYVYYPDQNVYTLVVRYSPVKAVVFDWRLVDEYTVDFHEFEVSIIGQDKLVGPPKFDGPWTFPEWEYQL
jgi:hypothetical protein